MKNKDRDQGIPLVTAINLLLAIFCYLTKAEADGILQGEYDIHFNDMAGFLKNVMYFEQQSSGFKDAGDVKFRLGWGIIMVVVTSVLVFFGFYVLKMKDFSLFYVISPAANIMSLCVLSIACTMDLDEFLKYGGLDVYTLNLNGGFTFWGWSFLGLSILQVIDIGYALVKSIREKIGMTL